MGFPVIKNKILPIGKKFYAINLCGVIFAKGECNDIMLNHEKIHSRQMVEMIVLPFYLFYIMEWLIRLIQYKDSYKAYRNISFEKEAYANQLNLTYLKTRKFFNWKHYL